MKHLVTAFIAAVVSCLTVGALRFAAGDGPAAPQAENAAVGGPSGIRQEPAVAAPRKDIGLPAGNLAERLAALETRLVGMESQVALLESARRPLESDGFKARLASSTPQEGVDPMLLSSPKSKDFVLSVLEEERIARDAERDAERQRQREERTLERVKTLSAELGLNQREEEDVYSVLLEENNLRTALFEDMRSGGGFPSRDKMREEMTAINDWKQGELSTRLGDDLAQQVQAATGRGFGGFGGGGRGGNNSGGAGAGAQDGGGGGRGN